MARASTIGENAALTGLTTATGSIGTSLYLGVNTGDPGTTGALELSSFSGLGTGYTRQAITWATAGSPTAGSIQNTTGITITIPTTSAGVTINYFSTWNTSTISGTTGYSVGGALSASVTFPSTGGSLTIAANGGLAISIS